MASIFTYDPDPPRVSSPWSTSGSSTPQLSDVVNRATSLWSPSGTDLRHAKSDLLSDYGITKLEPEPQEGPTEYKLHLLLRPRRLYTAMSTGHLVAGSYRSRASLPASSPVQSSCENNSKLSLARSSQSRQQRLEQLTTQLLWRLQQSSPFHSSTTVSSVLPVLPQATPQLGVPPKPARLLPGLEESQGALYEIGVTDDGAFVGLTQDELDESLTNLQAMAASLGCKVHVLRRVVVGECEWSEDDQSEEPGASRLHSEELWVAEALVSPDLDFYRSVNSTNARAGGTENGSAALKAVAPADSHSRTEQIRLSITGPSTAGKSSLLGTLTTSVLDNGRGKSRLSLLKHRHEIPSGVTSSVAQELIGYAAEPATDGLSDVINYASGNIAAWDDVHVASRGGRLAFISDLPGLPKYLKSTLRGLVGWAPHYILLCVPATSCEQEGSASNRLSREETLDIDLALSYLDLCMKLETPLLVSITKMDLASRAGFGNTLTRVLSALKTAGKKPVMLPAEKPSDGQVREAEIAKAILDAPDFDWTVMVPIVLTSAVNGTGVKRMHAFIRHVPIPNRPPSRDIPLQMKTPSALPLNMGVFDVDEVFQIPLSQVYSISGDRNRGGNRGVVLCGLVRYGTVSVGDVFFIGPVFVDHQNDRANAGPVQRTRSAHLSSSPPQSASLRTRSPSLEDLHSSNPNPLSSVSISPSNYQWQRVRVVSVRNLRLPVQELREDQVGTVGVESVSSSPNGDPCQLGKLRKGMVLVKCPPYASSPSNLTLPFHIGFVASFPASEYSAVSPRQFLGVKAVAYIANVRSTVKVTSIVLGEREMTSFPLSPMEPELFSFDSDTAERDEHITPCQRSEEAATYNAVSSDSNETVRITFSFVATVEWVEVGSRVIVIPGISMRSSSTGGATPAFSGIEGFVGRVCDVIQAANA